MGVSDDRLRAGDLSRPFHGVRVAAHAEETFWLRLSAYRERMPQAQFFSRTTAARIYRIPLPYWCEADSRLHVSVPDAAGFPRARGVIGHHANTEPVQFAGYRVTRPVDTWCDLATTLPLDDLIVIGDFLITGTEPYDGKPPLASLEELDQAVRARKGRRGIRNLREALSQVRYGPLSPMETRSRLLIVRAGLPEPVHNFVVLDEVGRFVAMIDLAFVEWKVGVEYQGDGHREKERFRRDITRRENIEDEGWTVVYVSADDILRHPHQTAARIRSRLRARGAPF